MLHGMQYTYWPHPFTGEQIYTAQQAISEELIPGSEEGLRALSVDGLGSVFVTLLGTDFLPLFKEHIDISGEEFWHLEQADFQDPSWISNMSFGQRNRIKNYLYGLKKVCVVCAGRG